VLPEKMTKLSLVLKQLVKLAPDGKQALASID
jgi:hypothetical protein